MATTAETTTTTTTEAVEHAAKPGMPQLDSSTWVPQLFWVAVCFIVLYVVMVRVAIPGVGGAIRARKGQIEGDLAAAQKLKADTEKAAADYEQALATARAKANTIAQENRNTLQAEVDAEQAKADQEIGASLKTAEAAVAASRSRAMSSVEAVAADIAQDIVAALTGQKIGSAEAAKAVAGVKEQ